MNRLFTALILIFISPAAYAGWQPWDEERAQEVVHCASIYGGAAYGIENHPYNPAEGQNADAVRNHFQRLSNILRYFVTNSGREDEMRQAFENALKDVKSRIDKAETVDVLFDDIQECDSAVDKLYSYYTE